MQTNVSTSQMFLFHLNMFICLHTVPHKDIQHTVIELILTPLFVLNTKKNIDEFYLL